MERENEQQIEKQEKEENVGTNNNEQLSNHWLKKIKNDKNQQ